jgi:hypothetical protein
VVEVAGARDKGPDVWAAGQALARAETASALVAGTRCRTRLDSPATSASAPNAGQP